MAMGWLKLNTDVDFQVESGLAVAGIIGGDHEGKVILAACSRIQGCRDTEEEDVKATLSWARTDGRSETLENRPRGGLDISCQCNPIVYIEPVETLFHCRGSEKNARESLGIQNREDKKGEQ
jgi:hypothetical protein